ncbi:MAG TPA: hypothetical protein VMG12_00985 [Polyangiaceae bacterium]|nr:hypothetical protein [Polyangiaceae bacterium]
MLSIARLVRCVRGAIEATTELRESMQIELPAAGDKVLYVKGPRGTSLRGLSLTMRDAQGDEVALDRILLPWVVSGTSDVRFSYARLNLAAAGRYTLSAQNIPNGGRPLELVFGRPNLATMIGWIVAIVATAGALIASIVLAALSAQG